MTAAVSLRSTRSRHDPKLMAKLAAAARAIRTLSIAAIYHAGSGHPGGALSVADILAVLYGAEMNIWPERLDDPHRDRCVLSSGHAAPALYAAGAHFGFCTADEAISLRGLGSRVQKLPWADTGTSSPAQGFSLALGTALELKLKKSPARVYAILSDSELQDGAAWEAAICAAHHRANNLVAIVEHNELQSDALSANTMGLEPPGAKFRACGWHVIEIDGHDLDAILGALEHAFEVQSRPPVLIAHTVKGRGVPFMQNAPQWDGRVKLSRRQAEEALAALGCTTQECARWLDVHG